jgi:hypothetical protein
MNLAKFEKYALDVGWLDKDTPLRIFPRVNNDIPYPRSTCRISMPGTNLGKYAYKSGKTVLSKNMCKS